MPGRLADEAAPLSNLFLHPDGRILAVLPDSIVGTNEAPVSVVVTVRDARTNRFVQSFFGPVSLLASAALTSDGRTLVTRYQNGTFHFWEMATGEVRARISERGMVDGLVLTQYFAISPDGMTIASGCRREAKIYLWNIATGRLISSFVAHTMPIYTVEYTPDGKTLVTGSQDSTLMSWDMTLPNRHAVLPAVTLTAEARAKHWASLAGPAESAFRSIWAFAADRNDAVKFFNGKFAVVERVPAERIKQWIADLDSPQFAMREKADKSLLANVDQAEAELRRSLKNGLGAEGRKRAQRILEVQASAKLSPNELREIRAVEALEKIGTPEARELLRSLARGNFRPRTIREAEMTLRRLVSPQREQGK